MTKITTKKELCVLILEMLDVHPDYIAAYRDQDKFTEFTSRYGAGYWAGPGHDAVIQKMRANGFEPFAIMTGAYRIGSDVCNMTSYPCVTQEDVDAANANIHMGKPPLKDLFDMYQDSYSILAYVRGFDDEYGDIGVKGVGGGLVRTF